MHFLFSVRRGALAALDYHVVPSRRPMGSIRYSYRHHATGNPPAAAEVLQSPETSLPRPPSASMLAVSELSETTEAVASHREKLREALAAWAREERLKAERLQQRNAARNVPPAATSTGAAAPAGESSPTLIGSRVKKNKGAKLWGLLREESPPDTLLSQSASPPTTATDAASVGRKRRQLPHVLYRHKYKQEIVRELTILLSQDKALGERLLRSLPPDSRRLLLVIGTAYEFFGEDSEQVVVEVERADRDQDQSISSVEYDRWAAQSLARRLGNGAAGKGGEGGEEESTKLHPAVDSRATSADAAASAPVTLSPPPPPSPRKVSPCSSTPPPPSAAPPNTKSVSLPWWIYLRLLWTAGLPFLAFGALDNTILILAGESIDRNMSLFFGFSSLAAAGLGGVVSGVAGIQVHGLAERWVGRVAPEPPLTTAQRTSPAYKRIYQRGNTVGMGIGLLLGMLPLLFLRTGEEMEEEQEQDWIKHKASVRRQSLLREEHAAWQYLLRMEEATRKLLHSDPLEEVTIL